MNSFSRRPTLLSTLGLSFVALSALLACSKISSLFGKNEAVDAGSDAAAVTVAEAPTSDPGGVCTSEGRKVWGKWANRRTGLTPRKLGGKVAVGAAIGNRPHVLLFDAQGKGELVKIDIAGGSELLKEVPKAEGQRDMFRVTPVLGPDGRVSAYADYRDTYNNKKRRRVACELVANRQLILAYDDKPLLEPDDDKDKDKPDAGAQPTTPDGGFKTSAKVAKAVISKLRLPGQAAKPGEKAAPPPPVAAAPDAAAAPPPEPAKPEKAKKDDTKKALREIRDCRTFVDPDGTVWAVATELHGEPQTDQSIKWSTRFFVAPNAGGGYHLLDSVPYKQEPKELFIYEAPSAATLPDGTAALTARVHGALMLWLLANNHKPTGKVKVFRGGFPTMAELFPDDSGILLLTSQKTDKTNYELRFARITTGVLPTALEEPAIEGAGKSLSEPTLATVNGQRWLAYHTGAGREGQLTLVPIDEKLHSVGKSSDVVGRAGETAESRIFPLEGGKLLAVYIQGAKDGDELVSQVLSCTKK